MYIRNRCPNPSKWKRNVRRDNRVAGKPYVNKKVILISEKIPADTDCKCKFRCVANISYDMRRLLWTQYYALADASAQKSYICSLVVESNTLSRRGQRSEEAEKTHSIARSYFLQVKDMNIRVCLKFLCDTFKFSSKTLFNALKYKMNGMYVGKDGRKGKPALKGTPESIILGIKGHIDSFPRIELHYCRRDARKRYLDSSLNISIMLRLYKKEFCPKNSIQGANYDKYRQVFNNYNPPFHHWHFTAPKKDQSTKCNIYKDLLDKSSHEEEHALHKRRELEALQSKEGNKKKAKQITSTVAENQVASVSKIRSQFDFL